MAQTPTLLFQAQGPPESICRDFLKARRKRNTKAATTTTDEAGSALLQSIRAALRGSSRPGAIPVTQARATDSVHQTKYTRQDGSNIEEELAWDEDTVCWSRSGLIRRYWDFSNTGENVRWACMGRLERQVVDPYHPTRGSISASNPTLSNPTPTSSAKPVRTTFGPFFQHAATYDKASERSQLTECVFVFLRTSLRVFSLDGTDYTVSLPFLVRQAWPLWPHSVLIQRQIDARELDEAEHSGEELLPSLFTLTSPFAELSAVNIASELVHNPAKPDHWTVPQRDFDAMLDSSVTLPATETVVGLNSHWAAEGSSKIIATVDRTSRQLSIWQYAYVIPESTTTTAPSSQHGPNGTSTGVRTVEQAGKRPAAPAAISPDNGVNTAASTSRPSSTIQDMNMDNIGSTEPSGRSSAASQTSPVSEDMPPDVLDDFDFDQVSPALWMHRIHVEDISQVEYVAS
jgi:anaphase-promoting complex subunit 1